MAQQPCTERTALAAKRARRCRATAVALPQPDSEVIGDGQRQRRLTLAGGGLRVGPDAREDHAAEASVPWSALA